MLSRGFYVFGARVYTWDVVLLIGIVAGYFVLRRALAISGGGAPLPRALAVRYVITVYVAVITAQSFAYVFDANTTVLPPHNRGWLEYYFSPVAGPKTLYGAIISVPLVAFVVSAPWRDLSYQRALDCWTPALMAVLAFARVGCFLQGCCYGKPVAFGGLAMPKPSPLYFHHYRSGWIDAGDWSLPAIPTQAISAVVIACICLWCFRQLRQGRSGLFAPTIAFYSSFRFVIELVRDDAGRNYYGALSTSQWIALTLLAAYGLSRLRTRAAASVSAFPA